MLFLIFSCLRKENLSNSVFIYKTHKLSNGYELIFQEEDTSRTIILKNKKVKKNIKSCDIRLPSNNLGSLYLEYKNVIVIRSTFGSSIIHIDLFDKNSGKLICEGANPFYYDSKKEIIIFEQRRDNNDYIVFFDAKTLKQYAVVAPKDNICITRACWKVVSINNNEITVEYNNAKDSKNNLLLKVN